MTTPEERRASLFATALEMLAEHGIEPFPYRQEKPRAIQWMMPPELIEDLPVEEGVRLELYGYPVVMEAFLGENSLFLLETLAAREVLA